MGLRSQTNNLKIIIFILCAVTLGFTVLADIFFLKELKQSYADTEHIISGIASGTESGDTLLKWLKETPESTWLAAGEENMLSYGYDSKTSTVWDRKYQSARNKILLLSFSFGLFIVLSYTGIIWLYQKRNMKKHLELEKILRQIQDTDSVCFDLSKTELDELLKDRIQSLWEQIQTDHTQMLREQEETKSMVTDISHQLKTPVAALKTSLELLASEDMTEAEHLEFQNRCMDQLDGLENLAKALVNVSRMEKGMIQLQAVPADIKDTIRSAVSRLYEKAADKNISIEMSEDSFSENILVLHDKKWTAEVFVNILDNAIKYSGEHTQVTVSLENLTNYLRINIADEGIGIPKSEYPDIFQRFYRGNSAKEVEGSGVGLYLAREIIEKQNGIIFVHSKPHGNGSIFSVQLPKC